MTEPNNVIPIHEPKKALKLEDRADDDLVLLARGGRIEAFEMLIRRHQDYVIRCSAKYTGNGSLAEDAAQRTFVELYRYLPRYQPQGKFRPFLSRLMLNQCRMLLRSGRSMERVRAQLASQPEALSELPDEDLLAREQRKTVDRAVEKLSEKLRAVVVLRFSADLSYNEIAEALKLPVGTVKSRLAAGMDKLRQIMEGNNA